MKHRKTTAWKKNRKLGDIYGGRERLKCSDNIFYRLHNLQEPSGTDVTPILMQDNPSRDFFFPISAEEAHEAIKALPNDDHEGITHIWLRRIDQANYKRGCHNWAEFICGRGVRVVVLYPWRRDMIYEWSHRQPSQRYVKELTRAGFEFRKRGGKISARASLPVLRRFYIQTLLYHEVGHHIDWYFRHWSKANNKQVEEYAEQYALQKSATATYVLNRLDKLHPIE